MLPGIRQHLRHVVEDPQVATPTRTVVELGPQHPLGSVGLHVTPQRIQLLDNADLSVPAGLTPEPRRTAKQHQSPLAIAAAGRVPPGVHQRTRLLKITGMPHRPLLTLGCGRLTPQPGKENLVCGACDISRRRSFPTPNLPMPTRARTTGNRPPAKIQIADGDQHRHRGALFTRTTMDRCPLYLPPAPVHLRHAGGRRIWVRNCSLRRIRNAGWAQWRVRLRSSPASCGNCAAKAASALRLGPRLRPRFAEGRTAENRPHPEVSPIDTSTEDEVTRLLGLGATKTDVGKGSDRSWVVMADPEGNEFCVLHTLA